MGDLTQDRVTDNTPSESDDTPTLDSSSSTGDTGDVNVEELVSKLEELENRVAGQTRSYQQIKQEKEQLERRLRSWQEAGIDPDEIDNLVSQYTVPQGTGSSKQQQVVTPEQLEERLRWKEGEIRWDIEKSNYFRQNPDYDTPDIRALFDAQARDILSREMAKYGTIQTTDVKDLLSKTVKQFKRLEAIVAKKKEMELTTQEKKLKEAGLPATKGAKPPETKTGEDELFTKEAYVAAHNTRLNRIRGLE